MCFATWRSSSLVLDNTSIGANNDCMDCTPKYSLVKLIYKGKFNTPDPFGCLIPFVFCKHG